MSLAGLALVLAAALCHATWNVCLKKVNAGPELVWLFSILSVVIYAPLALWVIVAQAPRFGPPELLFLIGSTALHMAYFLLLQTGYRKGDLSVVYPIARATGPLLSTGFAIAVLGETISPQMALGAAVIVSGVVMLSGGLKIRGRQALVSLGFGLAAGGLIGSYTVWDAYSVSVVMISPLLLDYVSSAARTVLLTPLALRRRVALRATWATHRGAVLAIAVFNPLAYILVLYAMTFTPVAYVAPVREVSVVLTVLAGSLILGEGHLRRRAGWAVVIVAGMALLVTG
ncbi:EamA family transporter [Marinovum sp.]|uniref:EamA family transporter n=1 Tax=Marinovum sp. TaxID=2024839 RepID=UPI003A92CDC0